MPLQMPIACECGKSVIVSEAELGCAKSCDCGRTHAVPRLDVIRVHNGLPAIKPNYREWIISRIQSGQFPPNICQSCGTPTDQTLVFVFDTEFKLNEQARQNRLLGGALIGGRAIMIADFWARESDSSQDFDIPVVLPLCGSCSQHAMMRGLVMTWSAAKLLLLTVGFFAFLAEPMVGLSMWAAAIFFWATEDRVRSRRIQRIRNNMDQIPEYHALMIENPRGQPVI